MPINEIDIEQLPSGQIGISLEIDQGLPGPANTLAIGTVTSGPAPAATITGSAPQQTLNLVLPKGDTGSQGLKGDKGDQGEIGLTGPTNSLSIGTVTSGETAAATITGTAPAQVLNLVIEKGDKGDTGSQGIKGDKGDAATIALGTVSTGAAGSSVTITNSGTSGAAVLDFSIPRGDQGIQGIQGIQGNTGPVGPAGSPGPAGPNLVSTTTSTELTGFLYGDGTTVQTKPDVPQDGNLYARKDGEWVRVDDSIIIVINEIEFTANSPSGPIVYSSQNTGSITFDDLAEVKDESDLHLAKGTPTISSLTFIDASSPIGSFNITYQNATELTGLTSLNYTRCGHGYFSMTSWHGNLSAMTSLSFDDCGANGFTIAGGGFGACTSVSFNNCGTNNWTTSDMYGFTNLQSLNFFNCATNADFVLPNIGSTVLTSLNLNGVGGWSFSMLNTSNLTSLTSLNLAFCGYFSSSFQLALPVMPSLHTLYIDSCGYNANYTLNGWGLTNVQSLTVTNSFSSFSLGNSADLVNCTNFNFFGTGFMGFMISDVSCFNAPNKNIIFGSNGFMSGFVIDDQTTLMEEVHALTLLTAVDNGSNVGYSAGRTITIRVTGTTTLQTVKASLESKDFVVTLLTP